MTSKSPLAATERELAASVTGQSGRRGAAASVACGARMAARRQADVRPQHRVAGTSPPPRVTRPTCSLGLNRTCCKPQGSLYLSTTELPSAAPAGRCAISRFLAYHGRGSWILGLMYDVVMGKAQRVAAQLQTCVNKKI